MLKGAFKERTVDKLYHALVQGHPDPSAGTIDAPIGRHPTTDWKFAVVAGGRPSVTHYETIEAFRAATLLEIRLETGRTHQIRVHFSALRHPCVGDPPTGPTPRWPAGWACAGSGCTPGRSASRIPPTVAGRSSPARTRPTWSMRSSCCATDPMMPGETTDATDPARCER